VTVIRSEIKAWSVVMDHRGVEYLIVQTANPSGYLWTVHFDETKTRTGVSRSRGNAIFNAIRAIDKALNSIGLVTAIRS
jgi:hypothetical protein